MLLSSVAFASAVTPQPDIITVQWHDATRIRSLDLRIHLPERTSHEPPAPLVIYLPDISERKHDGQRWAQHWATQGYTVIRLLMPGPQRAPAGITPEHLLGPVDDVSFVLSELARLQLDETPDNDWVRRIDLKRSVAAGHGFGAQVVQSLAGQIHPGPIKSLANESFSAFIALSPLVQGLRKTWPERYGAMQRPLMLITGNWDGSTSASGLDPARRSALFEHLPQGHAYQLTLDQIDHAIFAGNVSATEDEALNPTRLNRKRTVQSTEAAKTRANQSIAQFTTLFLDTYLKGSPHSEQRLKQAQADESNMRWVSK